MSASRIRAALALGLIGSVACFGVALAETMVLRGGTLYASPDAAPLTNATVVIQDGVIDATAPLPPHMQQSWNLLGLEADRFDPIENAPEE